MPHIETRRLLLRPFELADAPEVQRLAGDRAIADTTLNIPHPYEDGFAEQWIETHRPKFEAREVMTLAVTLRDTGALIGAMSLKINSAFDMAELGYWIGKPFWNRGYGTEAAIATVEYGFDDLDLNRIHANHLARNPASGRVMQKIGMTHEGVARQHTKKWDRHEDLVLYGLLRDEWSFPRGQ
jgi:RimJ/RimL family protein N-acetyltransferase